MKTLLFPAMLTGSLAFAACGSTEDPAPAASADKPAATSTQPSQASIDRAVTNRVKARLKFVDAERYRLGRVTADDGDVTIYTGIGADSDGEMAANGVCAEVWGLQGESAPKGVQHVSIMGRNVYKEDETLKDC